MSKAELLLVGAGPVGCLLASSLMHQGKSFGWFIRNPEVRELSRKLVLRFPDREIATDSSSVDFPARLPSNRHDNVIVCVKSQQTEHLLSSLPVARDGRRLAVANGLVSGDHHLGLLYGGAYLDEGRLVTRHTNTLRIGSLGSIIDDSNWFIELLACEWLKTEYVEDMELLQWHKLCLNCVVNPLTALLDVPNGSIAASLQSPLVRGIATECHTVARRHLGRRWTLDVDGILQGVADLIEVTAQNSSSMREDLRHGRETEIGNMNAAIARVGRGYDVDCPLNTALSELVVTINTRRKPAV